jgi:hypothetical protein
MLTFHPEFRITVEEALEHPYLEELHSQMEEPVCEKNFDFDFEKHHTGHHTIPKPELQQLMYKVRGRSALDGRSSRGLVTEGDFPTPPFVCGLQEMLFFRQSGTPRSPSEAHRESHKLADSDDELKDEGKGRDSAEEEFLKP